MGRYSSYKPTSIQWIKEIPAHWEERKAKYVFSSRRSVVGTRSNEYELLSLTLQGVIKRDMENPTGKFPSSFDSYQEVHNGDFVFCLFDNEETPRTVGLSNYSGMITGAYDVFECNKSDVLSKFILYYYLTIDDSKLMKPIYRGLRKTIPYDSFMSYRIPLPPLAEQEKIVSFLESKTSKIDEYLYCQKQELDLYKELIESIIYSKNTTDNIVFTSWEDFFDSTWQTKLGKGLFDEVEIKGVSSEHFLAVTQDKGLIYKDVDGVNFVTAEKKETQKLVCPGEFVISLRSFEGGIEYSTIKGLVSPAYVVLRLREEYNTIKYQMYFRFLFKSVPFVNRLNSVSDSMRDGKAIKFSDIKHFPFPIPSNKKLEEIYKLSEIYDVKKKAFEEKKLLLKQYKQRLIADVVTGQVNVQNEI